MSYLVYSTVTLPMNLKNILTSFDCFAFLETLCVSTKIVSFAIKCQPFSRMVVNKSKEMLSSIAKVLVLACFVAHLDGACDQSSQILQDLTFHLSGAHLEWPCSSTKNIYVQSGRYIPKNVIMTRSQIYRDEAFVTLPRLKTGVPFTLGKISMKRGQCSANVVPYPCWSLQEEGSCTSLQSAGEFFKILYKHWKSNFSKHFKIEIFLKNSKTFLKKFWQFSKKFWHFSKKLCNFSKKFWNFSK